MAHPTSTAASSGDLLDLVSSSQHTTIYPTDDALLSLLQSRFRNDLPYTRIGSTHLVVVNPYKVLGNVNEASAKEYEERCYKDTSGGGEGGARPLQPHLYDVACKMYLLMRRKREAQAVVARGHTSSGKSHSLALLTSHLLRLSSHSKREVALASQIKALNTILSAFGNAKTVMNPDASRHSKLLELHFTSGSGGGANGKEGRIAGAKVLTYNLDKSRLGRLHHEERTFHIFYQFLSGATPAERDYFSLEDPSDYALLSSSGTYRLPSGPFSDDSTQMGEVREALRSLGFKPKHLQSIFTVLTVILLMSNLTFGYEGEGKAQHDEQAFVSNPEVLAQIARLLSLDPSLSPHHSDLSVGAEELQSVLTNRTRYVRKEVVSVMLDAQQAERQRDRCLRDLYAILFAYVVETCNHRLAPVAEKGAVGLGGTIPILLLDQAGFSTRGPQGTHSMSLSGLSPFLSPLGTNGFEEFTANFAEELLNDFVLRSVFAPDTGLTAVLHADLTSSSLTALPDASFTLGGEELLSASSAVASMLRGADTGADERIIGKKVGGIVGVIGKASGVYKSKGVQGDEGEMVKEMSERVGAGYGSVFSLERPSIVATSPSGQAIPTRYSNSHHMATLGGAGQAGGMSAFTVTHFAGPVTYSSEGFIEKDADLLDASFVTLLRTSSSDPFVQKLVSGPGMATERHAKDPGMVVSAQVSSARSMRGAGMVWGSEVYREGGLGGAVRRRIVKERGGEVNEEEVGRRCEAVVRELEERGVVHPRMDPNRIYGVCAQVGQSVSEVIAALESVLTPVRLGDLKSFTAPTTGTNPFELPDVGGFGGGFDAEGGEGEGGRGAAEIKSPGTRLFVLSHIRPNDSGSPNSFDKRRVKAQLKSLGIGEIVKRTAPSPVMGANGAVVGGLKGDWTVAVDAGAFCERYVGRMRGTEGERVRQCVRAEGWREGIDYLYLPNAAKSLSSVSLATGGSGQDGRGEQEREGEEGTLRGRKRSASLSLSVGAGGLRASEDGREGGGRVWLTYEAWKGVEDPVRAAEKGLGGGASVVGGTVDGHGDAYDQYEDDATTDWGAHTNQGHGGQMLTIPSAYGARGVGAESNDNLLGGGGYGAGGLNTPNAPAFGDITPPYPGSPFGDDSVLKEGGNDSRVGLTGAPGAPGGGGGGDGGGGMTSKAKGEVTEEVPTSRTRRWWLWIVWATTFLIPSFLLRVVGRMKRPDVRLAWREKVTICWLILLLNGTVIFYIVEFGRLLCPNYDKAWRRDEVQQHQGEPGVDWWVSIQGSVYDLSDFIGGDHSDIANTPSDSKDYTEQLGGSDMTYYFQPPLVLACPGLVDDAQMALTIKNTSQLAIPYAVHTSGALQTQTTNLRQDNWYSEVFMKKMKEYRRGPLVWKKEEVYAQARSDEIERIWAIYNKKIYDLTDYVLTLTANQNSGPYKFLDEDIVAVFRQRAGQDITIPLKKVLDAKDANTVQLNLNCLGNAFFWGEVEFRNTARCQVQNYLLIIFSIIMMSSMALKFLAALQLTSKASPELQDKFILAQVPCYTEGEDSLRRTIDSLAALNYDDKRKLIFIICDGNIIGSGNDRTTPRIALDILGVDPNVDPEPLLFKSIGEGSKALNYGKVYSGLYEFEGHVVPYMVVVKVGKPTERSKPGNRGKRDSQILLMHYLNRVHFDLPMNPLELEIYHQMRNVIGIDPAFYEYIFTIDADTTVTPDSLNRLVASSADDSSIIGICGETKLTNEQTSWWTMIQVYEYYISHHLSKAFESLFGSVTCLPGCFSLYRIRTADKGRPIIISNRIIEEYAEPNVDTLHKKNLFSLGEDRFLTTLLMKHFPQFKTKFCPDAVAHTMAPESWKVLFSQRRRWINSTVHNLCELVLLPELFGFCCFSMRFFVFIDLLSTMILPATVVYLMYLIIVVATKASAFPRIAIIMLGVVYGLQAIIFILKREFMLIGWMVVYIVSYPIYSFFLPVYSFWCMDEFSWGNTRLVVGEGKEKKVIMNEDEKFDESMIPLKKFSEYEAEAWETGSNKHSDDTGYQSHTQSRSRPPRSRDESPHNYNNGSQAGDYYRDTNMLNGSRTNLNMGGSQQSHSNLSHQIPMPITGGFGAPQLPFMPGFPAGPGSDAGSIYGGIPPQAAMMGYQNTGSVYGMPMMPPRNTMMSNMNMFGGGGGGMMGSVGGGGSSQQGGMGMGMPMAPFAAAQGGQRPMSTFSMATSVNPFAGPSMNANPTDEELFNALRNYLSTQDLMSVTKKTAREAIAAKFPKADLTVKKDFLNQSIDRILSET
ncbi:hypothetical protein FA13DRAFT_1800569 [Coprinellus micaceus]|uniref:chitin synthase n=1 Tax=Coprinellus micaceus TaxID=71717 RepID=A0A4Y7SG79_COPMI|nr:hypothetical protein FA13DRAFT_1800569 [Coprinellus micaceus]